jgi:hypothetical protein
VKRRPERTARFLLSTIARHSLSEGEIMKTTRLTPTDEIVAVVSAELF